MTASIYLLSGILNVCTKLTHTNQCLDEISIWQIFLNESLPFNNACRVQVDILRIVSLQKTGASLLLLCSSACMKKVC